MKTPPCKLLIARGIDFCWCRRRDFAGRYSRFSQQQCKNKYLSEACENTRQNWWIRSFDGNPEKSELSKICKSVRNVRKARRSKFLVLTAPFPLPAPASRPASPR